MALGSVGHLDGALSSGHGTSLMYPLAVQPVAGSFSLMLQGAVFACACLSTHQSLIVPELLAGLTDIRSGFGRERISDMKT